MTEVAGEGGGREGVLGRDEGEGRREPPSLCGAGGGSYNPSDVPPQCEAAIPVPTTLRSIPGQKKKKKKSGGEIALRFFFFLEKKETEELCLSANV